MCTRRKHASTVLGGGGACPACTGARHAAAWVRTAGAPPVAAACARLQASASQNGACSHNPDMLLWLQTPRLTPPPSQTSRAALQASADEDDVDDAATCALALAAARPPTPALKAALDLLPLTVHMVGQARCSCLLYPLPARHSACGQPAGQQVHRALPGLRVWVRMHCSILQPASQRYTARVST